MTTICGAAPYRVRTCAPVRALRSSRSSLRACGAAALPIALCALIALSPGRQAKAANLAETLRANDGLALFAEAVRRAGMTSALTESGSFILFAPSDEALVNEGSAFLLKRVLLTESNAERLKDLVEHHIGASTRPGLGRRSGVEVITLSGPPLRIDRQGSARTVDGRAVVTDRHVAENGVIYVVDRLLWPRDWQLNQDVVDLNAQLRARERKFRGVVD